MSNKSLIFKIMALVCFATFPSLSQEMEIEKPYEVSWNENLISAVDLALTSHPSIMAARASALAAGADVSAANWGRFPSASVEGLLLNQAGNNIQMQALIDQPLWTGGRITGVINAARAKENAAIAAYEEASLDIALSVIVAFYELHRWSEKAITFSNSLNEHNRMVETMERRYAQDVSPLSDLELARSRASQIEQSFLQARLQERLSSTHLAMLTGDPYFSAGLLPLVPEFWPQFDEEDSISQSFAFNPLLKRLRFEAQSAVAEASVAEASVLPQVSAQYSYSEIFGHRVGLVLKAQTEAGLSGFANAEAARQRRAAKELQIMSEELQLRDNLNGILREYQFSSTRLEGVMSASYSSQQVMESYMRQFTDGRRTWLDVMNAVREATSSELDVIDAKYSALSFLAQLHLYLGHIKLTIEGVDQ